MTTFINEGYEPILNHNFTSKCGKKYVCEKLNREEEKLRDEMKLSESNPKEVIKLNGFWTTIQSLPDKINFLNMKVRDDDIFICSYPRSGTTWTSEMVWCIMNDLDFKTALNKTLSLRVRRLDLCRLSLEYELMKIVLPEDKDINNIQSPRIFCCHSPFIFLPLEVQNRIKNAKVIYALRDPRDVCLSNYIRFSSSTKNFTFDEYCEVFLQNKIRNYWGHVESYLKEKDNPNLFISTYEEKIKDLKAAIRNISQFLRKEMNEKQISKLCEHLQFDKMKANQQVNGNAFHEKVIKIYPSVSIGDRIREGKMGQGKLKMNETNLKQFERQIYRYNIDLYK